VCVHFFGRVGSDSGNPFLASDQIVVREIDYSNMESVTLTKIHPLGSLLNISVKGGKGLIQKAIAGGDVWLSLSHELEDNESDAIDILKAKVARS